MSAILSVYCPFYYSILQNMLPCNFMRPFVASVLLSLQERMHFFIRKFHF